LHATYLNKEKSLLTYQCCKYPFNEKFFIIRLSDSGKIAKINDNSIGAHFKKGGIFLALKGLHIPAQGNALGNY
jgi:hypothetical protein